MTKNNVFSAAFIILVFRSFIMAEEDVPQILFDFSGTDAAKEWQNVNDGVMGGLSEGKRLRGRMTFWASIRWANRN